MRFNQYMGMHAAVFHHFFDHGRFARTEGVHLEGAGDGHIVSNLEVPILLNVFDGSQLIVVKAQPCLLYTSPSPRDATLSRMPSSA